MAGGDGLEDDQLAVESYSQLLFSDDVDDLSADGCFNFASPFLSENPPKMLCFGPDYKEEGGFGFDNKSCSRIAQIPRVAVACSDSSSASSTNNGDLMAKSLPKSNKKRNVSGLGSCDEQIPKNQSSEGGNGNGNGSEKTPVRSQLRNCNKKIKSDNSSQTTGHAKAKKEKLGERILALQQLVSPFGKSDTASVLHEAMGYIRFLHDQVQVLCSPYLQSLQRQHEGGEGESRKDIRSKGLCLVPVELTLHVADDNGADFWSPAMVNSISSNQY